MLHTHAHACRCTGVRTLLHSLTHSHPLTHPPTHTLLVARTPVAEPFVFDFSTDSSWQDVHFTLQFFTATLHREVLDKVASRLCEMQHYYRSLFTDLLSTTYGGGGGGGSDTYANSLHEKLVAYPHFLFALHQLLPEFMKYTPADVAKNPAFDLLKSVIDLVVDTLELIPFVNDEAPSLEKRLG